MGKPVNEQELLIRANYHCEYCGRDLLGDLYEMDHIIPEFLGGLTISDNLAMSCARCNRNKGERISFIDPYSKKNYRLFNPRKNRWDTHFRRVGAEIVGKTPRGAATAALLFRATRRYAPPDLYWDKIEGLQRSERLYRFLNNLRFQRLNNQFGPLQSGLEIPLPLSGTKKELETAEIARLLLNLEMLFTRSTQIDIAKGIKLAEQKLSQLPPTIRKEIRLILSILYQQRATIRYANGDLVNAHLDQQKAEKYFGLDHLEFSDTKINAKGQAELRDLLRSGALKSKYVNTSLSSLLLRDLLRAAIDLQDDVDFRHFTYLSDIALMDRKPDRRTLEALYTIFTEVLEDTGYGQTFDRARFVTLRRRWWLFHLSFETDAWLDALIADIIYWRSIKMHNEARELRVGISRIVTRFNNANATAALDAIDQALSRRSGSKKGKK